jgi:tetratricopeptide (TPR) repeat protein
VDAGREAEGAHYVPRLFRNAPGAFFRGRIHEHAFGSLEPLWREWGLECRLGKTRLLHHGYVAGADTARAKAERNLRLIQLALEEQPDDVNLRMNLGLELTRTGQAEAGLGEYWGAFQRAERQSAVLSPELREALLTQLCTRLLGDGRAAQVPIVLESGLARQQPLTASLHYLQGLACVELERWNDAVQALRQCIARRSQPAHTPAFAEIHGPAPEQALARCLSRVGQQAEAEQTLRDLVQRYPRSPEPVAALARFLGEYDRAVEAFELLHAALPRFPGDTALWLAGGEIALGRAEYLEFASDWTGEAFRLWPDEQRIAAQRAEALLLRGDTAAALPLWRQVLTGEQPGLHAATILCELCQGDLGDHALNGRGAAVAREFIRWYQRLARYQVHAPLLAVNSRLPELRAILPSAAQALESALAEASR